MAQPTPYLVSPEPSPASNVINNWLIYQGGNIYVAGCAHDSGLPTNYSRVYKANDAIGSAWTEQDNAHHVANPVDSFYPQSGGTKVYFLSYDVGTLSYRITSFDFVAGTYSTVASGGPTAESTVNDQIHLAALPNGHFVVVYSQFNVGTGVDDCHLFEWNGAAWTVPVLVKAGLAGSRGSAPIAICTVSNTVCVLRSDTNGVVLTGQLNYFTYTAGVVSPDTLVWTGNVEPFRTGSPSNQGFYQSLSNTVIFPGYFIDSGNAFNWLSVDISPPAAPTSVVTNVVISPPNNSQWSDAAWPLYLSSADGSKQYLLLDTINNAGTEQQIWLSQWTGSSWSAAAVYWDSLTSPPPGYVFPEDTGLWGAIDPSGRLGLLTTTDDILLCGIILFLSPPAAAAVISSRPSGGMGRERRFPNFHDICLYYEYLRFINLEFHSGCKKPSCFNVDERKWGRQRRTRRR